MHSDLYQLEVSKTMKPLPHKEALCAWSMGLAGEVGEVVEPLKKYLFHDKTLDVAEIEKELGDVLWYLTALCTEFNLSLSQVMSNNVDKLKARYPKGIK